MRRSLTLLPIQKYQDTVEALRDQLVTYCIQVCSTCILQDAESHHWADPKPFYEVNCCCISLRWQVFFLLNTSKKNVLHVMLNSYNKRCLTVFINFSELKILILKMYKWSLFQYYLFSPKSKRLTHKTSAVLSSVDFSSFIVKSGNPNGTCLTQLFLLI